MGEIEGSYRALPTPGTRLGTQTNAGISTLEQGQSLSSKSQGKGLPLRVQGLDDVQEFYDMETKADGQALLNEVYRRLNLIESDYFGLEFQNVHMNWTWLEPLKLIVKQVRRPKNTLFRLSVKFFPPDPGQLQEEFTRYLFALQMKRDLIEGRLHCSENTAALLASHLLQSEMGDYDDLADRDFLKLNKLLPSQDVLQEKIMEFHRRHLGQTPADSDFQVLEIARKLEMYGVRFHPAADREGTKINLAVAHMGLQVFQGNTKINTFNWSKIRKLSFKRKRFLVKLHPEVHGPHEDTLEFLMASRDQCKVFWKNCVEHHTFFRLFDQPKPKSKAILFSRGSSFRYSGRTQKQLVEYVRDSGAKRTPYQRRNSKSRISSRSVASDVPKQSLSFNESLRVPATPSSATVSFHSLRTGSPAPHTPPLAGPPISLKEETSQAATSSPPRPAFPGALSNWEAGDCSPHSVCVESSPSHPWPLQNGSNSGDPRGRVVKGGHIWGGTRGLKGLPAALDFGCDPPPLRPAPVSPLGSPQLQLIEEYIDDDPSDISFFAGAVDAYGLRFEGADGGLEAACEEVEDEGEDCGDCGAYGSELMEFSDEPSFFADDGVPHVETNSLLIDHSVCSSVPDSLSLGLGGSEAPSEASSMVNFPAYSVRSEASSAAQFGDLAEQLEQLSCPATGAEGSSAASSDCDSDWGYDGGQSLFFSSPLTGVPGVDNFLLECHNLQALGIGDAPAGTHVKMYTYFYMTFYATPCELRNPVRRPIYIHLGPLAVRFPSEDFLLIS
uniref:FERM, ARH/RhoGEF and pleckstrin domain protein 2 n=1 Tax=Paramormyrops kingsleyae TaxID=1676925 RepID=A0A3B3RCG9_9TELE